MPASAFAEQDSKAQEGLELSQILKCLQTGSEGCGVGGARLQDWGGMLGGNS